jgi:tripartite-type tricarboxylate transporter receptor subunit TctC
VAVIVKSDAPWKSLADFLADARKNPGKLRAALPGLLTQADLVLRLFNQTAGVDISGVPFSRGGSEMLGAVMGGHVESAVGNPAIFLGQVRAGNARVLAVFSKVRLAALPDVPTTVELGYKVTFPVMYFLMGPKNLDREIVDKLVKVYGDITRGPRVQAFAKEHGYLTEPLGPEPLTKEINEYRETYRRLVQDLKLEGKR